MDGTGTAIPVIDAAPLITDATDAEAVMAWWQRQASTEIDTFQHLYQEVLRMDGTRSAILRHDAGIQLRFHAEGRIIGHAEFSSGGDLLRCEAGAPADVQGGSLPTDQAEMLAIACHRLGLAQDVGHGSTTWNRNTWPTTTGWRLVCGSWRFDALTTDYNEPHRSGGKSIWISLAEDGTLQSIRLGGWGRHSCGSHCGTRAPAAATVAQADDPEPALPAANN